MVCFTTSEVTILWHDRDACLIIIIITTLLIEVLPFALICHL